MKKSELRKIYTSKRTLLTRSELEQGSTKIAGQFISRFNLPEYAFVHYYLSIKERHEVDCIAIVNGLPNKRFAVPRINPGSAELESVEIKADTQFVENSWGISEPLGDRIISETEIDMVIVPLLCFDKRGHRVGYGKGFYDRFLSKCRTDCLKVGLSFFSPIENIEDIHDNDVPLDYCCTPKEVFEFRETR